MMAVETSSIQQRLLEARGIAELLFECVIADGLIAPGVKESDLNEAIYALAREQFGITKYWHKRIVRVGENTVCPYRENPPDVTLRENDVVFFDFGPLLEEMEADFGRTYVLGNQPEHLQLLDDLKEVWRRGREYYFENPDMTGQTLHAFMEAFAKEKGYVLADWHCGHLIETFPHEKRLGEERVNYICPENEVPMNAPAANGESRFWILEAHLIKPGQNFGGFVEDLLFPDICID